MLPKLFGPRTPSCEFFFYAPQFYINFSAQPTEKDSTYSKINKTISCLLTKLTTSIRWITLLYTTQNIDSESN